MNWCNLALKPLRLDLAEGTSNVPCHATTLRLVIGGHPAVKIMRCFMIYDPTRVINQQKYNLRYTVFSHNS